jgi:hypothetical protein
MNIDVIRPPPTPVPAPTARFPCRLQQSRRPKPPVHIRLPPIRSAGPLNAPNANTGPTPRSIKLATAPSEKPPARPSPPLDHVPMVPAIPGGSRRRMARGESSLDILIFGPTNTQTQHRVCSAFGRSNIAATVIIKSLQMKAEERRDCSSSA